MQGALAWIVLVAVLAAVLGLGGNREVVWVPMVIVLLVALGMQVLVDMRQPAAWRAFRKLWLAVLCYLLALGWVAVQSAPVPLASWAHPAWEAVGLTGTVSASPDKTQTGLLRLAAYAAAFWLAVRAAENTVRVSLMVDLIAVFGGALAIYGLLAWMTGTNPLTGDPAYPGFVTASFVNRNAYALYASIGCMACLTAIAMRLPDSAAEGLARSVAMREFLETLTRTAWPFTLGAILCGLAMLLTGSRAGALCGLLGIAMVLMSMVGRHLGRRSAFFVLLLLLIVPGALVPVLTERLAGLDPLEDQRLHLYGLVMHGISDRPLLGHGLGAFQESFRAYIDTELGSQEWDMAHSSYLENAWELGIPAALALTLAPVLIVGQIAMGLAKRKRMRPVLLLALGVGLAGGIHAAVDFSLQMPATAALFAIVLGLGWGLVGRPPARGSG